MRSATGATLSSHGQRSGEPVPQVHGELSLGSEVVGGCGELQLQCGIQRSQSCRDSGRTVH